MVHCLSGWNNKIAGDRNPSSLGLATVGLWKLAIIQEGERPKLLRTRINSGARTLKIAPACFLALRTRMKMGHIMTNIQPTKRPMLINNYYYLQKSPRCLCPNPRGGRFRALVKRSCRWPVFASQDIYSGQLRWPASWNQSVNYSMAYLGTRQTKPALEPYIHQFIFNYSSYPPWHRVPEDNDCHSERSRA